MHGAATWFDEGSAVGGGLCGGVVACWEGGEGGVEGIATGGDGRRREATGGDGQVGRFVA